ncbi:hypothetical protein [Bacillus marinisedimentorum]|uniref:hypothetical protein n=1 Tax=Bacillus marinisedimentorum TaxID=1821260 RepID=UPI000871BF09|nr:hypothetical protein [Bacillus marinisedimentorum]
MKGSALIFTLLIHLAAGTLLVLSIVYIPEKLLLTRLVLLLYVLFAAGVLVMLEQLPKTIYLLGTFLLFGTAGGAAFYEEGITFLSIAGLILFLGFFLGNYLFLFKQPGRK